ncbi:hypothetical protein N8I77_003634 [Diaporthe amygdali]|uniref:Uncharacterized protein n=1 Tax=Phomopsis amygdali TaxID=1214568 RepID=A0AAD9SLU9_PHOAM|nr:hypothetical protein N8I77_003634 [Diaporthe amygdali]
MEPRLTVGLDEKVFEILSRKLESSTVPISEATGYQIARSFIVRPEAGTSIYVPDLYQCGRIQSYYSTSLIWLTRHTSLKVQDQLQPAHACGTRYAARFPFRSGRNVGTRRSWLHMLQGSLFVAPDEIAALKSALGKRCTEMPPGLEHSTHYRSVQYSLGHVSCVVQGQVSALCGTFPEEPPPSSSPGPVAGPVVSRGFQIQHEVAKTNVRCNVQQTVLKSIREDFWFSPVPINLCCYHKNGPLVKLFKINIIAASRKWEENERNQTALRKLATLLSDLKRAVGSGALDGQACIGLLERYGDPATIQAFLSEDELELAPEGISKGVRDGKKSHGLDKTPGAVLH